MKEAAIIFLFSVAVVLAKPRVKREEPYSCVAPDGTDFGQSGTWYDNEKCEKIRCKILPSGDMVHRISACSMPVNDDPEAECEVIYESGQYPLCCPYLLCHKMVEVDYSYEENEGSEEKWEVKEVKKVMKRIVYKTA